MNETLQRETERLVKSWERHEAPMLRDYLVAGVEDPRCNVQSILSRHFLACAVFGQRFPELMEAELRFAVAMNWLLAVSGEATEPETWASIGAALESGADNAEGVAIPSSVRRLRRGLPGRADGQTVPEYLGAAIRARAAGLPEGGETPLVLDTFMRLWRGALEGEAPVGSRVSVVEPACGSANDYRFLDACGLARVLEYTGFDLSEKNVDNARAMFPGTRFAVGNAIQIAADDRTFDYAVVHDLFEHLSLEALEVTAAEVCRVTRSGLCLGFFQMDEVEDHVVRPVDDYHVNTLSLSRMMALFARHGFTGEAIHIGTFLRLRFGVEATHNSNAYTLVLGRTGGLAPAG